MHNELPHNKHNGDHEGSWREYRLMILDKLETLAQAQEEHKREMAKSQGQIYSKLSKIQSDLAAQKVKVGFIGSITGAITGLITALVALLKGH